MTSISQVPPNNTLVEEILNLKTLHLGQRLEIKNLTSVNDSSYFEIRKQFSPIRISFIHNSDLNGKDTNIKSTYFNIDSSGFVCAIIMELTNSEKLINKLMTLLGEFTNQISFNTGHYSNIVCKGWVNPNFCLLFLSEGSKYLLIYYNCNAKELL